MRRLGIVSGWLLTILGWYFLLGTLYLLIRAAVEVAGPEYRLSSAWPYLLVGVGVMALMSVAVIRWGRQLRANSATLVTRKIGSPSRSAVSPVASRSDNSEMDGQAPPPPWQVDP